MRKKDFDLIFVYEPSPITVCIPAIILKKIKKIPIYFWVLDLWPESLLSSNKIKSNFIPKILMPLIKYIYINCDKILVSSKGFIESISEKNISKDKIIYFPQWAENIFSNSRKNSYHNENLLPDGFNIMFAGNIGSGQDIQSVIEAAYILRNNKKINWILIGEGSSYKKIKKLISDKGLKKKVFLLGQFPLEDMPFFYSRASAMLISLKKENIYSMTIPAKLQSYMAFNKPILSMVDGVVSSIIKESNAGLTCPAESPKYLAQNALKLSELSKNEITKMGNNAKSFYEINFNRDMLVKKLINIFKDSV